MDMGKEPFEVFLWMLFFDVEQLSMPRLEEEWQMQRLHRANAKFHSQAY